ncbi:unnamed protein product, partial [Didymodactylos carnosus]
IMIDETVFIVKTHVSLGLKQTFSNRLTRVISYGGAIVIYDTISILYGSRETINYYVLLFFLWNVHFLKRLIESIFVHKFRQQNTPIFEAIGEFIYYYLFAFWITYSIHKQSLVFTTSPYLLAFFCTCLFIVCMLINGYCHLKLRFNYNLANDRYLSGLFFDQVTTPHYTAEIVMWLAYFGINLTLASFLFAVATFITVTCFANQRHQQYKKRFKNKYPKNRKCIIPFLF